MSPRTNQCTDATVAGRLRKAEQFMIAAQTIAAVLDQDEDPDIDDAYVTLLVHSGIASADVICCKRLGEHSNSTNHADGVKMVKQAEKSAGAPLKRLLDLKTRAGYSPDAISGRDRTTAESSAQRLLDLARTM